MNHSFIHLHLHSEYSLRDGLIRVKPLLQHCVNNKIPAIAITDFCNLFSVVKFFKHAINYGIKPIIGAEVVIEDPNNEIPLFNVVLLCQNETGYRNLTLLISRAYSEGQVSGSPRIQKYWLTAHASGLIMLSGSINGDVGQALINGNHAYAKKCCDYWSTLFPNAYFLELTRTNRPKEEYYIHNVLEIAKEKNIPVVATNDVRFLQQEDFEAHEARVCIHDGYVLEDGNRPKIYREQQYLRSVAEMQNLFADIPSALANTVEIAKRCNVDLNLEKIHLPAFPIGNEQSIEDYLSKKSAEGLKQRISQWPEIQTTLYQEKILQYEKRLQMELAVINKMGFAGYFLIVADFISWAKNHGIGVGPGRGSGVGSLVAYALKITDLDPIYYDLLFERFLNPERISLPDFDVDFCMEGRDRVIDYVAEHYGRESVSQIITFGTMAAKAVVRDVGRVLGYPYGFVDKIAKLIPFELGITLEKALAQEDELQKRYDQEEDVHTLINLAKKLEGLARNAGKHAGGVVIAPSKLTDYTPLYCEPGSMQMVTQFDKDDVEAVGLVKFDFLGLRTLTIIDWTIAIINEQRKIANEEILDFQRIAMDDAATFQLLKACNTTGIFQLESRGMKDLIKRLQPDSFEDIIALVALYRPGPLQSGMVDDFINRKHGQAALAYLHPNLEALLRETYGVILYQEQVMQIAQHLAGYTLGGADVLRRAMGKKKPEEMAKQRKIFLAGSAKNQIAEEIANAIFDLMEKFSGYGFNKSHAAAYAMLSYQTAWLKAHYPAAFLAAVLSSEMDHTDKISIFINECYQLKLIVLAPDINCSHYKFTIIDAKTILYGLGAVKGIGEAAIESMIHARNANGAFQDLFDLCCRVDLRKVNRRVIEALIRSGALDSFGEDRAVLFANIDNALRFAEQQAANHASGQNDLFSDALITHSVAKPKYITAASWPMEQRLQGEKETLGIYFSGHPLDRYQQELKQLITAPLDKLTLKNNQTVMLAGMLTSKRIMLTRRGDRMAFIAIQDASGSAELAVFSDVFEEVKEILNKDALIIIEAEANYDEANKLYKLNARKILTLEQARAVYAKYVKLLVQKAQINPTFIDKLQMSLKNYSKGNCPICFEYHNETAKAQIDIPQQWWVQPLDQLIKGLQNLLGEDKVIVVYN